MQELVSIIVPVYRVECYLPKCVDSLRRQTYKDIEILLVDDGSPDDCGKLCDLYAKEDGRIRVIHKKNGGLSDARNIAIPKALGQYITFVDSDDWVSEFYVGNLYKAIKKDEADLACSWFENVYEEQRERWRGTNIMTDYQCLSSHDCLKRMFYQNEVECCAWGKLYRKEIIADLQYPVGKLYEDIPVTYECIKRAKKIAVISNIDYFYLQRDTSIQYQEFNPKKLDGVEHCRKMMEAVKEDYPDLVPAAECRYLSTVCNILFQINEEKYGRERQQLWSEVKKYRKSVLANSEARKKGRVAAAVSYMGYKVVRSIYMLTQSRGKYKGANLQK